MATQKHKPIPSLSLEQIARFWSKVNKNGPTPEHRQELGPCWMWTGKPTEKGYGAFQIGRRSFRANRIAYFIGSGIDPLENEACHKCDFRLCVNFSHLFPGTHQENIADMKEKGRGGSLSGDAHWMRRSPSKILLGENTNSAKLTTEKVRDIKLLIASGRKLTHVFAAEFGVSRRLLYDIRAGKIWKQVT